MTTPLPLEGLRVLDLTRALSGPFCAMILGDLGADVIKIEPAPGGDMSRQWGPFTGDTSVYYLSTNRNKRSVAIDFRNPEGLALIREMALGSDILLENFRTGVMDEMGLGYDALKAEHPELIWGSITGFGSTGPKGSWPGFDQIAQAFSGLMSMTGTPESGPVRVGVAIGDLTSGMWTALGVLAAVIDLRAHGHGQKVETSLLSSLVGLLSVQGQRYLSLGEVPGPVGNVHPVISPYGLFDAADGPLNIAAATQDQWLTLAKLLELDALIDDPRFRLNANRMQNRDTLKGLIEAKLMARTRAEWTAVMIERGIPAGPINDVAETFADPQVIATGLVETVEHPTLGPLRQVGNPIRMESLAGGSVRMPPPRHGEHTTEVLRSYGFDEDRIAGLLERRVVQQA